MNTVHFNGNTVCVIVKGRTSELLKFMCDDIFGRYWWLFHLFQFVFFFYIIYFICFCSIICSSWWRMLFVMLGNMSFHNTNMMLYFQHFFYIFACQSKFELYLLSFGVRWIVTWCLQRKLKMHFPSIALILLH